MMLTVHIQLNGTCIYIMVVFKMILASPSQFRKKHGVYPQKEFALPESRISQWQANAKTANFTCEV